MVSLPVVIKKSEQQIKALDTPSEETFLKFSKCQPKIISGRVTDVTLTAKINSILANLAAFAIAMDEGALFSAPREQ